MLTILRFFLSVGLCDSPGDCAQQMIALSDLTPQVRPFETLTEIKFPLGGVVLPAQLLPQQEREPSAFSPQV